MNNQSKKFFELNMIYLIVTIIMSIFYFSLTFLGSYTDITIIDVIFILILICIASLIEYLVVKHRLVVILSQKLTMSLAIFLNIYVVNLVFNEAFIKQPFYIEISLAVFGIFIAYTLLSILDDYKKFQNIFIILLSFITVLVFLTPFYHHSTSKELKFSDISELKILPIEFKKKPNVYMIGIDALVSKTILKKHLNIESTELHKILYKDFISYKNMFSGGTRTVPTYTSMLSLTPEYWNQYNNNESCKFCPTKMNRFNLYNGLTPSPLLLIFRANGYETTTTHEWPHFGKNKGPYLDNYLIRTTQDGKRIENSICDLTSPRSSLLGFFGYCKIRRELTFFKKLNSPSLHYKGFSYNLAWDLRNIESVSEKNKPQLFIGHILTTRHTGYDFNITNETKFEEFRNSYLEQCNRTARLLKLILDHISKNDPDALVFVWGDHGPILSQHLSWDKRYDISSDHELVRSSVFFAQDRFGVYGGIFNGGECTTKSFQINRTYSTPQHVLRDILHCLADNKSIKKNQAYFQDFKKEESFPMPRRGESKTNMNDKIVYEDFLYE